MKINSYLHLFKWCVRDYLFFHNRKLISYIVLYLSTIARLLGQRNRAMDLLFLSNRICLTNKNLEAIAFHKDSLVDYSVEVVTHKKPCAETLASRMLVLVEPEGKNKGVLLIKFTTTFADAWGLLNIERLAEDYVIVLEPSWAGYALPEILCWLSLDADVIIQSSEVSDRELVAGLEGNLHEVEFGSGDWADTEIFFPIEEVEKKYDVVMVGNYNSIKRHYAFFKCISKIVKKNKAFKAAVVCGRWGIDKDTILSLIDHYDITGFVDVIENLSQSEVNVVLSKARSIALFSLKEGSNRSIFEAMLANVPAFVLKDNVGVNKNYINSETGFIVTENKFVELFSSGSSFLSVTGPYKWAISNIAPEITTKKLEDKICGLVGYQYKLPIKVNIPEATIKGKCHLSAAARIIDQYKKD